MTNSAANATLTNVEKLRGLPWSIAANATNTVAVQFTFFGSAFILFLSELGLSKSQMGLLLSLLPFFGLIALFVAPAVARFGYKRTYITFFGLRNAMTLLLLFTPGVLALYGEQATMIYVGVIVAGFAVLRAIGVTGNFPWVQEYVPDSMRGQYTATNNVFTTLTGFAAVTTAGMVLGNATGLSGFMLLFVVGAAFGIISILLATRVPGGAPVPRSESGKQQRDVRSALQDRNFVRYLIGAGLVVLAVTPITSFLPLFMEEEVGLNRSQVVMLQSGMLLGSLGSSYLWGWTADRFGSKPIMLSGVGLLVLLPVCWTLMPRNAAASLYVALAIAVIQGVANMGWGIGAARLLYVSIVPPAMKSDYMALYFAWIGITGGLSQIIGGNLLDLTEQLSDVALFATSGPYTPLFALAFLLPILSLFVLRRIEADGRVSVGEFAGIFFRGNPFLATSSMIRFHLARDEQSTIQTTERLAQANSPLIVDELLETLHDPRFNVRFEAVVSIARTTPDPRLTQALVELLVGSELALTGVAAWALGRIGDTDAIEPLRLGLDADYRSIRAHCARALGALGDKQSAPILLERLQRDRDKGQQMAYAAALGSLGAADAIGPLLDLLDETTNPGARLELAISLARIVGDESYFVRLVRDVRGDPGTAMALALTSFRRAARRAHVDAADVSERLTGCIDALARNEIDQGARRLGSLIPLLPLKRFSASGVQILEHCAARLQESGAEFNDYTILVLHVLHVDWKS